MSILTNIQTNSFLGDRLTDCQVENNLKKIKKKNSSRSFNLFL